MNSICFMNSYMNSGVPTLHMIFSYMNSYIFEFIFHEFIYEFGCTKVPDGHSHASESLILPIRVMQAPTRQVATVRAAADHPLGLPSQWQPPPAARRGPDLWTNSGFAQPHRGGAAPRRPTASLRQQPLSA